MALLSHSDSAMYCNSSKYWSGVCLTYRTTCYSYAEYNVVCFGSPLLMQSTNHDSMMHTIESRLYYAFPSFCCLVITITLTFKGRGSFNVSNKPYDTFQVLRTLTMMPLIAAPFWVSNVILHLFI